IRRAPFSTRTKSAFPGGASRSLATLWASVELRAAGALLVERPLKDAVGLLAGFARLLCRSVGSRASRGGIRLGRRSLGVGLLRDAHRILRLGLSRAHFTAGRAARRREDDHQRAGRGALQTPSPETPRTHSHSFR